MGIQYRAAELGLADPDPLVLLPRCDYEWRLLEQRTPLAQWEYGKDEDHGWPYETARSGE